MAPPLTPKRVRVPGLLSEDGLAEGIAALKGGMQQTSSNAAATSGVDIGQQILDLDVQMPSPKAPSAPVQQPSTIQLSGSAPEAPIEQAQPLAPAVPGFGMLTPEQAELERQQRVEQANIDAAVARDDVTEMTRMLTDEQREAAGLPPLSAEQRAAIQTAAVAEREQYAQEAQERADFIRQAPPPTMTWWLDAMQVGARAAAQTGTSALKYPFSAFETSIWASTGLEIKTAPRGWLDMVDQQLNTLLPGDPSRAKDFVSELAAGAGSFVPFLIAGYVGSAIGLPAGVTSGVLGAAATGNQLYEEAEAFNAPMAQRALALLMGTGLGATEAIPIDRMLWRADVGTGGLLRRMLVNSSAATMEEFIQEFSQAIGEDMVAKYGAGYDPDRALDAMSWLRQGAIGGIVGGVAGGATTVLPPPGPREDVQEAAVQEVFDRESARFNQIVGPAEPDAAGEETGGAPAAGEAQGAAAPGEAVTPARAPVAPVSEPVATPRADGVQRVVESVIARSGTRGQEEPVFDTASLTATVRAAEESLTGDAARAVSNFIGHELDTRVETGVMDARALEAAARGENPEVAAALDAAFAPVREAIRSQVGDRIRLYRAQQPVPQAEGRSVVGFPQDGERAVLSWTTDQRVARTFAGVQRDLPIVSEEQIAAYEQEYAETGRVRIGRNWLVKDPDDPDNPYPGIYPNRDGEPAMDDMVTDTGSVREYIESDNEWARERAERNDAKEQAILSADVPVDDIIWVSDRAGQSEFIVRNSPDGEVFVDRTGALREPSAEQIEAQRAAAGLPTRSTIDAVELSAQDTQPLPNIEKGLTGPIPMVVKAARAYASAVGLPHRRQRDYVRVDTARAARIAQAYADMKHEPNDPAVQAAYRAMADETIAQYQFVKATGLKIDAIAPDQADPYPNGPRDVLRDIAAGHIWYFPTDQGFGSSDFDPTGNPLLEDTGEVSDNGVPMVVNDLFRVVHDFFGHGLEGSGFGARGEENAWQSHMRLYSAAAVPAMTSETRGQNSWVNYGPFGEQNRADPRNTVYADQKTGIMPSWTWTEGVADSAAMSWAAPVEITDPEQFHAALMAAKEASKFGGAVHAYTPAEYGKMRLFLSDDGLAGFALNGEDIVSVFSRGGGRLKALIDTAIANGGRTLDAFDTGTKDRPGLPQMYAALGFVETGRVPFDPAQAPESWPAELGQPDVVFMELATDAAIERMIVRTDALPLFPKLKEQGFDRWFKKSKVVKGNGQPKIVFHGTPGPGFSVFDPNLEGTTSLFGGLASVKQHRQGFFFAESKDFSKTFAEQEREGGGTIMPVYLSIQKPFNAADQNAQYTQNDARRAAEEVAAKIAEIDPDYDTDYFLGRIGADDFWEVLDTAESGDVVRQAMQELGYDGIQMIEPNHETGNDEPVWVVFDQTQIKSALQNTGAYSPFDPDIERMATGTSSTRQPYVAEPTRPARGVPEQPNTPVAEEDVKLTQIGTDLRRLLNLTVRHGRLTGGRDVMGEYNRKTGTIRMRTWSDLSTLVHEAGHAINDNMAQPLDAFVQRNAAEIMRLGQALYAGDLSNAPAKTRQREGFAEFFRVYTLTPAYARNKWPALTADFENTLRNEDPAVLDGLNNLATRFEAWLQLPSSRLIRNMVVDGRREQGINAAIKELKDLGFKSWFEEYTRRAVDYSVNRFAPLNSVVNRLLQMAEETNGGPLDLKRAEDPRTLVRLARNSGSRAMVEVTDGVYGYRSTQPMSRGLRDAIMLSQGIDPTTTPGSLDENRLTDFSAYIVALRAQDEFRRMDEGKIDRPPIAASKGDVKRAIRDYEARYGQSFKDAAAIVHEYGMALWQKQYDAGLMSKETYLDGLDRQFYAPLQRDMSDKKANFGPSALTAGQRSLVRQFHGSDRDIVDPLAILMQKTFALEQLINENEVIKNLALLADRAGRAGALVERIPASKLVGMTMTVEEAARQIAKDDSMSPADAQDLMTLLGATIQNGATISLFRRDQASTQGENILFYWENGKPAAIQLSDGQLGADVVNVLQGVGRENMPLFSGLVASVSTTFRTAITSWPDFLIVNYIRDQLSAWILNDVGFVPFASGIRGMADEIRQKTWAKSYNAAQGIMGGMNVAALHEAKVDQDIRALRSKGYVAQAFSDKTPILGAIRGFARVTALSETGTRLGLYRGAFNRAKADGLNDYEASVEAAYTATDYIDFGLNGSRMTLARRTIPFLNAQLQGFYKMLRTLGADEVAQRRGLKFALVAYFKSSKNLSLSRVEMQALNTGRKAWVKMAALGLLSALLHFLFRDDPDYQEAGEYLRTTGWVIPIGDGRVFYIPKPFELALMANAVERGLEFASGDSEAPNRFLRGAAMSLVPPTTPTAFQTITELGINKDFFSGRDIVPTYMQALEPPLQYDNYTSSLARWAGQAFNMSPMQIDHVLSGLGASAYRDITGIINAADPTRPSMDETDMPLLRRFVRDVRRGSASAQDFWAQASQTTGRLERTYQTYKRFVEYGNDTGANGYLASLTADEQAYALLMTHFKADQKRLNPFYRARQVSTVVSGMRREMASELGLGDTTIKDFPQAFDMTAGQKQQVDEILSEIARREVRNTLIATGQAGWQNKEILPLDATLDMLLAVSPDTYDEYMRRYRKAKIYDASTVYEYWPEVRDRLVMDGEFAVLSDVQTVAGVVF